MPRFLSRVLVILLVCSATGAYAVERIDFNRQIRPILSDGCFHCHGPDDKAREGGFRLDLRDSAIGEADSGEYPIVPKLPDASEILRRVASTDESELMPPPGASKKPLKPAEIALLRKWIEQGAEYEPHWAFQPPQRAELPKVQLQAWPRNPIDHFVLARQEAAGLKPSAEADRRTLIRRVTLDLTGLPPTPEEVDRFLADKSPQAYETLVDRLLASPRYGERMAWPWLDAARYADTNGYQGDPTRTMWPWRDWVVKALNDNMPFDQFSIEQLAGDQLPNATNAQIVATAFNRNHMHNGEGGRIAEETRVENVFDRTETTATVWMGLTYTCCRCHTHKFDPISHTEYFGLYDFFNQTSEAGRGGTQIGPLAGYISQVDQLRIVHLDRQLETLGSKLTAADPKADSAQLAWEAKSDAAAWEIVSPDTTSTSSGATLTQLDDLSLRAVGKIPATEVYTIVARTKRTGLSTIRLEALQDAKASPANSTGRADNGNAVLSEFEVTVRPVADAGGKPERLKFVRAKADHAQRGHPIEQAFDGNNSGGAGWATEGFNRKQDNTALFHTDRPFGYEGGTEITFVLRCESHHIAHVLARVRLALGSGDVKDRLQAHERLVFNKPAEQRTADEKKLLAEVFRGQFYPGVAPNGELYSKLATQLAADKAERDELRAAAGKVKLMVMDTLKKPRATRILEKGLYDHPIGEPVSPTVPSALPSLPAEGVRNRLMLARWLMAPEHPLTARVTVNRYWQLFFGNGLVKTSEDFGTQGEPPTHPQLLDWLATEFIASGWDVKHMHRLIVTSATYRQSSDVSAMLLEKDHANKLLTRQSRFRLPSWMLRDQALFVSGLAAEKLGGPPVKPYQPEGIWNEATFGKIRYRRDSGEALYRRSLYVFWRRIVGPTMFFDVANRQTCSVKSVLTNTPLHALTTLNDITYVEAARGLATRLCRVDEPDDARVKKLFLKITSREPTAEETKIVIARLANLKHHFADNPADAGKLLAIGESPLDASLNKIDLAAYTAICNTLMNLDEVLNRP